MRVAIVLRGVLVFLTLAVVVVPTMQLASPCCVTAQESTAGAAAKALSGARTLATTLEPPTVKVFLAVAAAATPAPPRISPGFSADPFVPPRA